MNNLPKIISNIIYAIGAAITLALFLVVLFGSQKAVFPDAMLPYSWKEIASFGLAFGCIPMLISCMSVYKFNNIKTAKNKATAAFFIFCPHFFAVFSFFLM